jgi:hypothetical protein
VSSPNPEAAGTCRPTVIALLRRGRSGIIVDCEYEEAEGGRHAEEGRRDGEGPDRASDRRTVASAPGDPSSLPSRSFPSFPGQLTSLQGHRASTNIVFVLGVPGVSSVTTSLDFDAIAAGGDSLLQGSGLHVQLESSDGQSLHAARIVPNGSGRLAQIRLTVTADDFSSAENEAFDAVMPTLSRIAFQADTPLEVTAISLTERATQTRQLPTTLVGAVQPAPEIAETTTPELRMFLAAYRKGLNGNSPLYPMTRQIPVDPDGLADVTVWSRGNFMPYLGKSLAEIRDAVTDTIRNAVAHISPNMDLRIADYAADIQACRTITRCCATWRETSSTRSWRAFPVPIPPRVARRPRSYRDRRARRGPRPRRSAEAITSRGHRRRARTAVRLGPRLLDDRQLSGAQLGDLVPCSSKRAVSRRCCAAAATSAVVCQVPRRIEIMQPG